MHEVFEEIGTSADIPSAVSKLVREGKIPASAYSELEKKLNSLVSSPGVAKWFAPGIIIFRETEILTPSGNTWRPDRVIISDGKATVIDFKFGEEDIRHNDQTLHYSNLLAEMGYG